MKTNIVLYSPNNVIVDMCFTNNKQGFLVFTLPTTHKILSFASKQALTLLSNSRHWNSDKTSRISSALFTQSYYIHVWDKFIKKSIFLSCDQDKPEGCYHELYQSLVTYETK
ncbi:unnamed protein product [Rotaria socialis]|uniref:Uncharacterized protein n=1 Tax=Rotaria socialis TaxID=392032 RepID=A0A821SNS8_9BILA|nr:unnamed protein product [Rotaria socialis]CAF3370217.1 unnamed protein product [Rotaria socialis]CAF3399444.1 unnamed protein product [Rotaria socialis]CAF3559149.1 unnamed protein product [Rotaria socialis]CAF3651822.1 unnamed protein product [Rotaria socialis]